MIFENRILSHQYIRDDIWLPCVVKQSSFFSQQTYEIIKTYFIFYISFCFKSVTWWLEGMYTINRKTCILENAYMNVYNFIFQYKFMTELWDLLKISGCELTNVLYWYSCISRIDNVILFLLSLFDVTAYAIFLYFFLKSIIYKPCLKDVLFLIAKYYVDWSGFCPLQCYVILIYKRLCPILCISFFVRRLTLFHRYVLFICKVTNPNTTRW